ncbi:MAG: ribonuclease H-like domain-containing protein [Chloroflexi bacterium]|nr:ribonuclease H-like domain-containing protein [Chloroflexota bacterium]
MTLIPDALDARILLFGHDPTPGIVSVNAGRDGHARIWRRQSVERGAASVGGPEGRGATEVNRIVGGNRTDGSSGLPEAPGAPSDSGAPGTFSRTVLEDVTFPSWLYLADATVLDPLRPARLGRDDFLAALGGDDTALLAALQLSGVATVELAGNGLYRWLGLTTRPAEVEARVLAAYRKRGGGTPVRSLGDLHGVAYSRPPVEQYLTYSGQTCFKGMAYEDLRRLQFDLETTGLSMEQDRIFMISIADSDGLRAVFDVDADTITDAAERALIERFVRVVQERDPDVFENHNIFGFDLPFLVRRAAVLGVPLALGRDGSAPTSYQDSLKVGERSDSFTRWTVAGREVVDTLHAVRRYGAIVRDMRHQGLKEAARYFGVAREGREYVPGPEIWATFQRDPDRVRRYALDDVLEVDELSRLLLRTSFAIAQMVPKPYERIATSGTGQGLIEPLLVRGYLTYGRALPGGQGKGGTYAGGRTELFTSGVVRNVVKADVASLYPSLMLTYQIGPRSDTLGAFLALLRELTALRLRHKAEARRLAPDPLGALSREALAHEAASGAMKQLINSFYGSLGTSFALFGDTQAAGEVTRRGREILGQMLMELERRGVLLVEADTDGVLFSVPDAWTEADEHRLIAEVGATLPEGIRIEHDGRYAAMYSYAEKNYILLGYDGRAKLVGGSFRSSRSERYGEQFLRAAAPLLLSGDFPALRELYLDTVTRLRSRQVPVDDLCISVILSKNPETYARSGRREEQYEVLLHAGRSWRSGERVRYYQARGGRKKLADEFADDADAEYYIRRLKEVYSQRLARAVTREDFELLFGENLSLFETSLGDIRAIATRERTPTPY